jgi:hypothetical protein
MVSLGTSRGKVIQQRWWALAWVLGASTIFWLVVGAWQAEALQKLAGWSAERWILAAAVAMVAVLWPVRRGLQAWLAFYDLRHFWARPPYWLAVVAGLVAALWLAGGDDWSWTLWGYELEALRIATLVLVVVVVMCLALAYRRKIQSVASAAAAPKAQPIRIEDLSDDQLLQWIQSDDAIVDETQDLFGYSSIARRMVDRLIAPATANADDRSQALLGPLGSGKTTILRMVERELKARECRDLEVLEVQMWAYESARAAVTGIIDKIVAALGQHVNVVGLRGVSGAYAEAISKVPHGSIVLAALRGRTESPTDVLAELDDISRVIGMRYVIWIEDLERFATGTASDDKLGVVRALLHGLHLLPSFTIITATTDLSHGFDLQKIARYVEHVPRLRADVVRRVCQRFLRRWRSLPGGAGLEVVTDAGPSVPKDRYDRALGKVLQLSLTPRALKQAVRRCNELWQPPLAGELNLEQALTFSIVREVFPKAYALIADMRDQLLAEPRLEDAAYFRPVNIYSATPTVVDNILRGLRLGRDENDHRPNEEITALATEVFIGYGRDVPQSFGAGEVGAVYWGRFNAQALRSSRESDQHVLRVLKGSSQGEALDLLGTEYGGAAARHLASWIGWESLAALLVPCAQRDMTTRSNTLWDLWRILLFSRGIPGRTKAGFIEKVKEVIDVCAAGYGLRTLADIQPWVQHAWPSTNGQRPFEFPSEGDLAELRAALESSLVRDVTDPVRLVAALADAPSHVLVDLVGEPKLEGEPPESFETRVPGWWRLEGEPPESIETRVPRRPKLAAVILQALELDPECVAPPVAELLCRRVNRNWFYEPTFCEQLFDDPDTILELLCRCTVQSEPMTAVRAAWVDRQRELAKVAAAGTSEPAASGEQSAPTVATSAPAVDGTGS